MRVKKFILGNLVTICTIVSVFAGVSTGVILKKVKFEWTDREVKYIEFPGEMFLRMLKSLIIPLLVSSIICAVGSLDLSLSKRIAFRSIAYYATTTVAAVILGIIMVQTIQPGKGLEDDNVETKAPKAVRQVLTQDTLLDLIRNLFPPNLVQATLSQSQTKLENYTEDIPRYFNQTNIETWKPIERYAEGTNVLGLVVFSIVLGTALGILKEKTKAVLDFCQALSEAMMVITRWVITLSPVGVYFLIVAKVVAANDLTDLVERLGWYFFTVMLGLSIHGFVTISILFFLTTRKLPFRALGQLTPVLVTAFGTASSSATMPLTIQTLDSMGIDQRVTRFVIPVGATINMDGTALYEAVAALFIAQFRKINYGFGQLIAVSITATFASIGAAGIPQAGLVTMVMVLDTLNLPAKDVSLILAVDWLLDRFRTTINVIGDSLGTIIVDSLSKDEIKKMTPEDKMNAEPYELTELTKDQSPV